MYRVCISFFWILLFFLPGSAIGQGLADHEILEGQHYFRLPMKVINNSYVAQFKNSDNNKHQVIMFFSFHCFFCKQLNEPFRAWQAKQPAEQVAVHRLPVVANYATKVMAKLYYAGQIVESSHKLIDNIFVAIHENGKQLWREDEVFKFITEQGYSQENFKNVYSSFRVSYEVNKATKLMQAYQIPTTPNIVVNNDTGIYVTNLSMVDDIAHLFRVVDHLL